MWWWWWRGGEGRGEGGDTDGRTVTPNQWLPSSGPVGPRIKEINLFDIKMFSKRAMAQPGQTQVVECGEKLDEEKWIHLDVRRGERQHICCTLWADNF